MIFGSVCSGVEAASVAWNPLGWEAAWFCENDKFPSAVLDHHYPDVPNLGDMTKIQQRKEYNDRAINILVGGTPCQSFSIAGLRQGLDDERGNLALKFGQILGEKRPSWFLWENVPGILSSNGGRDFARFLGLVCGRELSVPKEGWRNAGIIKGYKNAYGIAYRILDAQYFGVAQRRRRVFVVGYLGDWRPAAAVLFERESLHGNPAPSRKKGQRIAPTVTGGSAFSRTGNDRVESDAVVLEKASHWEGGEIHPALSQTSNEGGIGQSNQEVFSQKGGGLVPHRMTALGEYKDDDTASTIKTRDFKDATDLITVHGTQDPDVLEDQAHTLGRNSGQENAIAYGFKAGQGSKAGGIGFQEEVSPTITSAESGSNRTPTVCFAQNSRDELREMPYAGALSANPGMKQTSYIKENMLVRRLTPVECERLQGFPDNYTRIPWRGKAADQCPDGPRYKAMGNSMAVPVMRWIGERIQAYEDCHASKD